jgi:hypothetical protein
MRRGRFVVGRRHGSRNAAAAGEHVLLLLRDDVLMMRVLLDLVIDVVSRGGS